MAADPKFLQYVEDHQQDYIDRLARAVEIPSYVRPELPDVLMRREMLIYSGCLVTSSELPSLPSSPSSRRES